MAGQGGLALSEALSDFIEYTDCSTLPQIPVMEPCPRERPRPGSINKVSEVP